MRQFEPRHLGQPYLMVAAGEGAKNIELPDGTTTSCFEIKRRLGYPQLLAWKENKKLIQECVDELRKNHQDNYKLVIDSSAYGAWSRGITIDIDEYIDFINQISDVVYWFAALDKIPGKFVKGAIITTPEEIAEAPKISWENYLYMIERVNCPKKILPIFHENEDLKYLKQMLEYRFSDGSHIEYIGLGIHSKDINIKKCWYDQLWKVIRESSNPNVLIHNFGMTSIPIIEQYPSMSSDSTTWLRQASFGRLMIPIKGKMKIVYIGGQDDSRTDSIVHLSPAVIEEIEKMCLEIGHGMNLKTMMEDKSSKLKLVFNLYALDKWRKSFQYCGTNLNKETLW